MTYLDFLSSNSYYIFRIKYMSFETIKNLNSEMIKYKSNTYSTNKTICQLIVDIF